MIVSLSALRSCRSVDSRHHRGSVAVVVAVSIVAILALAGLGIDAGRLYVNKTELQNATDACALAAAAELVCDPTVGVCPTSYLQRATAAGVFVASKDKRDFQRSAVTIAPTDVKFSTTFAPNSNYLPFAAGGGGASVNSKFAMCTATSTGLVPWFMRLWGAGASSVTASAVATLAPSSTNGVCPSVPIGACQKTGGGSYVTGDWLAAGTGGAKTGLTINLANSSDNYGGAIKGSIQWVDWDPSAGGTDEVSERLVGTGSTCGISTASNINEEGVKQGAKDAYNTRFGIYPNGANAYTYSTAPPDYTGYAYPTTGVGKIVIGASAYSDFRSRQASGAPFQGTTGASTYDSTAISKGNGKVQGTAISTADYLSHGGNRRLVAMPIVNNCGISGPVTILSWGCFLLLNPMSNGNNSDVFIEYRGDASSATSPCSTTGVPSGPGTTGPLVPTLVQ